MEIIPNYLIKTDANTYRLIKPTELVYISPYNGKSAIYLKDKTHFFSKHSIDVLEKKISEPYFVRIHKNIILNMLFAKTYLNHKANIVTLTNGEELAVQKEYRSALFSKLLKI